MKRESRMWIKGLLLQKKYKEDIVIKRFTKNGFLSDTICCYSQEKPVVVLNIVKFDLQLTPARVTR